MGGKWPFGTLVPSPHYGNMGCQVSKTKKGKKLDRFLKKNLHIQKKLCTGGSPLVQSPHMSRLVVPPFTT